MIVSVVLGMIGVGLLAGAQVRAAHGVVALFPIGCAVAGAFCSCIAMIYLRKLGQRERAEAVSMHFLIWCAVVLFAIGLGRHVKPSASALLAMALSGVTGGVAQVAMTKAYSLDKAARVGAIGYSGVVISQILGVLVLHEHPTTRQLEGAALVVASGISLVLAALREQSTLR
ncbi:MAG: hypothetical protein NVSMB1_13650 [Polyangiales bacterium]